MNRPIDFVDNPVDAVASAIVRLQDEYCMFVEVQDVMCSMVGKTINKNLGKAVEKSLKLNHDPSYTVLYRIKYSWYELEIKKNCDGAGIRTVTVMLGYTSEGNTVELKKFNERNTPYTVGHVGAINKLKASLPYLVKNIEKAKKAQADLDEALAELGDAKYYVTK